MCSRIVVNPMCQHFKHFKFIPTTAGFVTAFAGGWASELFVKIIVKNKYIHLPEGKIINHHDFSDPLN